MFNQLVTSRGSTANKTISGCLFVLLISLFIFTSLTSAEILFWVFSVSMFVWNIDSRVSLAGALVFLTIIPLLTGLDRLKLLAQGEAWSESIAVWVFYFLAIGVMKQIWDITLENNRFRVIETAPINVPNYAIKSVQKTKVDTKTRIKKLYAKHDIVIKKKNHKEL